MTKRKDHCYLSGEEHAAVLCYLGPALLAGMQSADQVKLLHTYHLIITEKQAETGEDAFLLVQFQLSKQNKIFCVYPFLSWNFTSLPKTAVMQIYTYCTISSKSKCAPSTITREKFYHSFSIILHYHTIITLKWQIQYVTLFYASPTLSAKLKVSWLQQSLSSVSCCSWTSRRRLWSSYSSW